MTDLSALPVWYLHEALVRQSHGFLLQNRKRNDILSHQGPRPHKQDAVKKASQYGTNISISGLSFDTFALSGQRTVTWDPRLPDPNSVWLEGTAHTADALLFRGVFDFFTAAKLLGNIEKSQQVIAAAEQVNGQPIPVGLGIAAATSTQDTGFFFDYFQDLHIGATGWYLTAGQFANPFRLGLR